MVRAVEEEAEKATDLEVSTTGVGTVSRSTGRIGARSDRTAGRTASRNVSRRGRSVSKTASRSDRSAESNASKAARMAEKIRAKPPRIVYSQEDGPFSTQEAG